jgi:glycerol-3-phosphate acyltransferase PlsY
MFKFSFLDMIRGCLVWVIIPYAFGYLMGSVPFGLLLTKFARIGDIRTIGSGNIGATNVLRTGKIKLALLTLLLDGSKGALAVLLFRFFLGDWLLQLITKHGDKLPQHDIAMTYLVTGIATIVGIGAIVGHIFPIWLKGKGGKGVATTIGVITVFSWQLGVTVIFIWIVVAVLFRYSSLASLVSIGLAPLVGFIYKIRYTVCNDSSCTNYYFLSYYALVIAVLVFIKHIPNIRRLIKGEEPKIKLTKNNDSPSP